MPSLSENELQKQSFTLALQRFTAFATRGTVPDDLD
jgi:hypothetical protein